MNRWNRGWSFRSDGMRRGGRPVVVFTAGKGGSTSIAATLRSVTNRPVAQVHWLTPDALARSEARYPNASVGLPGHLRASRALIDQPPTSAQPWDVVTTVREPIDHAVSAFFQIAERMDLPTEDFLEARDAFIERHDWRLGIDWIEQELQPALGIDVYGHSFNRSAGWTLIDGQVVRLLVLRYEDLNSAPAALSSLLGIEVSELRRDNVGGQKAYAAKYERFRKQARLPAFLIDELHGSRFARHFYSDEELAAARRAWLQT